MLIQKGGEPFTLAQLAFSYASLADFPLNYKFYYKSNISIYNMSFCTIFKTNKT